MLQFGHDIITVGASAGGVQALITMLSGLPADLPAAVFIVQHLSADYQSHLPELLGRRCSLPVAYALHGQTISSGSVYVAPPDNHLTLVAGSMRVVRGPKENGHRPAVDALFRTASMAYGSRVIGVVLTGERDCGTAGMLSIKARGGLAVVQEPADAAAPSMPNSAIQNCAVDHVLPLDRVAELLARLALEPAGPAPELTSAVRQLEGTEDAPGAVMVCPHCHGTLQQIDSGQFLGFRCHVGHAFSLQSLASEQAEEVERALWSALRALEESVQMTRRFGLHSTGELKRRFEQKAAEHAQQAETLRRMLLGGVPSVVEDSPSP
ncbi:MAG TPA: chemotaxis protein CheB [Polyangiaceae bacterium]|nr:chemotaxis protein CheB [Polyangiaceae bacterium]